MGHSGHRIRRLPDRPSMIAMRYDMAVVTVSARCWFSMLSPPVDVDQCRPTMVDGLCRWFIQVREVDVNAIVKAEIISRRKALSLMGLAAAFGLAAAPTVLTVSDAEAQTVGMQRLDGTSGVTSDARGAPNDVRSGARVQPRARLQRVQLPAQLSNSTGSATSPTEPVAQPSRELKPVNVAAGTFAVRPGLNRGRM
jgi:hypothetical protein